MPRAASQSIFAAAAPEPFRILGLRLRPFSLGHYVILRRHACAFVADESQSVTREDLIFACLVCSMRFDEFNEWILGCNILDEIKAWGRKIGLFDLKEKSALFQRYLLSHSEVPAYWIERENDGAVSGAHWAHTVFVCLTADLHFSRAEAWDIPLSEALLHFYKHAENNGAIRLMTPDEIPEDDKEAHGT